MQAGPESVFSQLSTDASLHRIRGPGRESRERDRRVKEKRDKAEALVASIGAHDGTPKTRFGSQIPLPPEICAKICEHLAVVDNATFRTKGVVLLDLWNAAMACKDLNAGSGAGFDWFIREYAPGWLGCWLGWEDDDGKEIDWDGFVSNPTSFKVADLKTMARLIGVAVSGRKVEVIGRIYVTAFGCSTASDIERLVRQCRGSQVPALKMHYIGVGRAKDKLWSLLPHTLEVILFWDTTVTQMYPLSFRVKALAHYMNVRSLRRVASRLNVSKSSLQRWIQKQAPVM